MNMKLLMGVSILVLCSQLNAMDSQVSLEDGKPSVRYGDYIIKVRKVNPSPFSDDEAYYDLTPLTDAACAGDKGVAEWMKLEKIPFLQKRAVKLLNDCLLNNAKWGNAKIIQNLITAGVDVNTISKKTGRTALSEAASKGYLDVVKVLVANSTTIDHQDKHGNTPLSLAAWFSYRQLSQKALSNKIDVVKYLADKRADVNHQNPTSGTTALFTAAVQGRIDMVMALVEKGANVNLQNKSELTALQMAVTCKHEDIAEFLRNNGAQ